MIDGMNPITLIMILGIVLIALIGTAIFTAKYGERILKNKRLITNLKRINIILIIAFIIGIAGYIAIVKQAFMGWSDGTIKQGEEIIKTSLGDEFILKYKTLNFPDYQTDVTVYDKYKNSLEYYHLEDDYVKPNVTVQLDSPNMRCYEVNESLLIYRVNGGLYKGIRRSQIDNEYITKNSLELVDLSKAMIMRKEWKWVEFFGKFLLKTGDNEIRKTLERYASNNFTKEELDINKNSEIKREDIIVFAKQMLEQK